MQVELTKLQLFIFTVNNVKTRTMSQIPPRLECPAKSILLFTLNVCRRYVVKRTIAAQYALYVYTF